MKSLSQFILLFYVAFGISNQLTCNNSLNRIFLTSSSSDKIQDTVRYLHLLTVDSFNLEIQPPASGIQFYKDGIVFLSDTKNEGKMLSKHVSFGITDTYFATFMDSILGRHMIFSPNSSFPYPCESMTFCTDYDTMYLTKLPKRDIKEKIYLAKYISNGENKAGWVLGKKPLDFCTGNSTYTHPTLSADGMVLVFASDREGSLGNMDLFISRQVGGKWSSPVNLGNLINSAGNEIYPYLDSGNHLFFSSDGLPGYGGYDIFTCRFNGEGWEMPVNLSRRINSENDDIAFKISRLDGKYAFYTRRQISNIKAMQLLKVDLKNPPDNNILTISYIFNGNPNLTKSLAAMKIFDKNEPIRLTYLDMVEPKTDFLKANRIVVPLVKITQTEVKEMKVEDPEIIATPDTLPEKKPKTEPAPTVNPPEVKVVTIKPTIPTPDNQKDVVIYRVQFLSSPKPQKDNKIVINGVSFITYEYYYLGEYRYTIGEFKILAPAIDLQNVCRKSGFPQAFVAAFKNDTRSLDLKLFK